MCAQGDLKTSPNLTSREHIPTGTSADPAQVRLDKAGNSSKLCWFLERSAAQELAAVRMWEKTQDVIAPLLCYCQGLPTALTKTQKKQRSSKEAAGNDQGEGKGTEAPGTD